MSSSKDYMQTPDGRWVRRDRQNQQETQDKPQEEIQPYNREQYLKVLSQWLYLEDQQDIDVIMATAISICLPGDPIWMFIITAAGGSKTEILRTFSNNRTFSTSTLTPQTLISGLKGGKDIDLMPKLDGKLLIIKDFTSILSKKQKTKLAFLLTYGKHTMVIWKKVLAAVLERRDIKALSVCWQG